MQGVRLTLKSISEGSKSSNKKQPTFSRRRSDLYAGPKQDKEFHQTLKKGVRARQGQILGLACKCWSSLA